MARSLLVVAVLVSVVSSSSCSTDALASAARKAAPKVTVQLTPVAEAELSRPVHAIGLVAAHREAKLGFKVGGVVAQVFAEEGASVKHGQVLARLDPKEIDAQVVLAQNGVDKARRDRERAVKLHAEDVATTQQLQDATTAFDVAQAQLDVAHFNQAHAVIRAPFDGRVLKRIAEPEELVGPGSPVVVLSSNEGGWVARFGVPDREAFSLREGDKATVKLEALDVTLDATVSEVPNAASPTGLFEIELLLSSPPPRLATGIVATAEIEPSAKRHYRLVPVQSLVEGEGSKASVFTVDGAHAKRVDIDVAYLNGEQVVIASGLSGVEKVVSRGAGWLTDGASVEVAP